ncbi:MAG: ribosomal protein S18-alanine N-acetyltransferase [Longicatena sp.]
MIRLMNKTDLEAVMEIENQCFHGRWDETMMLYELEKNEFGRFYVYTIHNKVIGYIDFWITFETCQLANIAVHPDYQGNGYSKEMMDRMVEQAIALQCENIMLEVRVSNQIAKNLYERYGFIEINMRKNYYSDNGEDAFVMCKALGGN